MQTKLIHRISRIQGQLDALKIAIDTDAHDQQQCLENLRLLKAAINGLKRFGAAYMTENIRECIAQGVNEEELEQVILLSIEMGVDL